VPLVTLLGHTSGVTAASFSPDGTRVVTASWDNTARVWDATTGKPVTAPLEHLAAVRCAPRRSWYRRPSEGAGRRRGARSTSGQHDGHC
jgi:WD40 repeat protein